MQSWGKPYISNNLINENNFKKELRLFNSKTKTIEPVSRKNDSLKIYVCGITPYDSAHLGHAFTYITFDSIIRLLMCIGQKSIYAQNVTDLDDPLFEKARSSNQNWRDIVNHQLEIYRKDMQAMNVIPPNLFVGVEENIQLIIEEIESIRNYSYELNSNLYFSKNVEKNSDLVKGIENKELIQIAGERGCDINTPGKRSALDPILWRSSKEDEPEWVTNFGNGRPGWHIQCISLAEKYLSLPFDIQGGGKDLIYPHHSMCDEITSTSKKRDFAKYYFHVGMVGYQGSKMSKSKGNLVFVHELIKQGVSPSVIRLMLISKKWNIDWEFTHKDVDYYVEIFNKLISFKNKYILKDEFDLVLDHLLNNLDFSSAIDFIINVEKHERNINLISLEHIMNDLFGLTV